MHHPSSCRTRATTCPTLPSTLVRLSGSAAAACAGACQLHAPHPAPSVSVWPLSGGSLIKLVYFRMDNHETRLGTHAAAAAEGSDGGVLPPRGGAGVGLAFAGAWKQKALWRPITASQVTLGDILPQLCSYSVPLAQQASCTLSSLRPPRWTSASLSSRPKVGACTPCCHQKAGRSICMLGLALA